MPTQTTDALTRKVIDLVAGHTDTTKEGISLDSHFTADLGFDSLEKVEFVMEVEDAFAITVPDEDAETITTVGDAIEAIQKSLG